MSQVSVRSEIFYLETSDNKKKNFRAFLNHFNDVSCASYTAQHAVCHQHKKFCILFSFCCLIQDFMFRQQKWRWQISRNEKLQQKNLNYWIFFILIHKNHLHVLCRACVNFFVGMNVAFIFNAQNTYMHVYKPNHFKY